MLRDQHTQLPTLVEAEMKPTRAHDYCGGSFEDRLEPNAFFACGILVGCFVAASRRADSVDVVIGESLFILRDQKILANKLELYAGLDTRSVDAVIRVLNELLEKVRKTRVDLKSDSGGWSAVVRGGRIVRHTCPTCP
jgi:hypothetical protein